jgi:hypothetical protein
LKLVSASEKLHISGRSGVRVPPPKYRNNEAGDQGEYLEADLYPVPDRGGVSIRNPARRAENQPVQPIATDVVHGFSLDQAIPYIAIAIDAQIDRDDARDNFIKEKLHANIRSSVADPRPGRMTHQSAGLRQSLR